MTIPSRNKNGMENASQSSGKMGSFGPKLAKSIST
jgi:hypothetical protein